MWNNSKSEETSRKEICDNPLPAKCRLMAFNRSPVRLSIALICVYARNNGKGAASFVLSFLFLPSACALARVRQGWWKRQTRGVSDDFRHARMTFTFARAPVRQRWLTKDTILRNYTLFRSPVTTILARSQRVPSCIRLLADCESPTASSSPLTIRRSSCGSQHAKDNRDRERWTSPRVVIVFLYASLIALQWT